LVRTEVIDAVYISGDRPWLVAFATSRLTVETFWFVQGSIAAISVASLAVLGASCGGSTSGTRGAGDGGTEGSDTCATYTFGYFGTCIPDCASVLEGNVVCPDANTPAGSALAELSSCASSSCASTCPAFVGCATDLLDDAACAPCLQSKCATEWTNCSNN